MGEVLGIGITHAPMFQFPDTAMANIFKRKLASPTLAEEWKDPQNWPDAMREEWGDDEGLTAAAAHRAAAVEGFRTIRAGLDAFNPDAVLVFGDDQYENFQEDIVPTFCSYFFDDMTVMPFRSSAEVGVRENVWGKPEDTTVQLRGNREVGVHVATELIKAGFDIAWAMKPHHLPTLGHAFMRTLAYLDYDQQGFPWPYLPFHVNSYGSDIKEAIEKRGTEMPSAPPAPSPARCFQLGREIGRILRESPYRVAVVGSASWSHAFLTPKNHLLWPDIEADRERLGELNTSNQRAWENLELEALRESGQHELLNWICMAGVMEHATAEVVGYAETYIFNSTKVMALLHD